VSISRGHLFEWSHGQQHDVHRGGRPTGGRSPLGMVISKSPCDLGASRARSMSRHECQNEAWVGARPRCRSLRAVARLHPSRGDGFRLGVEEALALGVVDLGLAVARTVGPVIEFNIALDAQRVRVVVCRRSCAAARSDAQPSEQRRAPSAKPSVGSARRRTSERARGLGSSRPPPLTRMTPIAVPERDW